MNVDPEVIDLISEASEDDHGHYFARIPGQPHPQQRPRKCRNIWVSPSSRPQRAFQQKLLLWRSSNSVVFPSEPVTVEITCYMKRPNSHFKGGNNTGFLKHLSPRVRSSVPDIDNLAKFVLDAMNGIVYSDDRQVCQLRVSKEFDDGLTYDGKTVIHVKKWSGDRGFSINTSFFKCCGGIV